MDITKSENIHNVVKKILALYEKPPSIIVNCAGITMDSFMINMTEDSFDKVIDVNLKVSINQL